MSELTRCNHCSLQAYRRGAKPKGRRILLAKDEYGWIGVYEVPATMRYFDFQALPVGNADRRSGRGKYKIASFKELTRECCC